MANTIKPKRSNTAAKVPTTSDLSSGEFGVNMADQKSYINNGTTVVQVGAGKLVGLQDVTVTSPTSGQTLSWNGTAWVNATGAGSGTVTSVGITPSTGVTVSNSPITSSGNITVGLSTKLTAIENLSGAGFFTQNGSGAIARRTIQAGTGISVAHGNGSSQDPEISNTGVLGVTATSPVASSGGQNPIISMTQASGSVNGWLSSTDWTSFNEKLSLTGGTLTGDLLAPNLLPPTDNTGVVGNSTNTWSNGQFTNMTIDSTLNVRAAIDLADNDVLRFGSSDDWEFFHNGTGNYIDLNVGDLIVRDVTTTRFTFEKTTGNFTATGNITANTFNGALSGTATNASDVSAGVVTGKIIYNTFTATASQTTFTATNTYTSGKIEVFCNGVKMRNGSDVTVTSGTNIVFASGLTAGDLVDLVYPI
jgi:hypothetical protein